MLWELLAIAAAFFGLFLAFALIDRRLYAGRANIRRMFWPALSFVAVCWLLAFVWRLIR